jgi:hypothetical protein
MLATLAALLLSMVCVVSLMIRLPSEFNAHRWYQSPALASVGIVHDNNMLFTAKRYPL